MKEFSYRRPSQRGPASKVWILAEILDKRAAAEAVLGVLTMFEPVVDANPPPDVPDVAVPMPDGVPDAAPDVPESAPEPTPEPVAMPMSPPPILATLRIAQADSIILPSPPPVVAAARLLQQEQRMIPPIAPPPATEPLPPLPEPDFGSLEFWNEHPFFRPPEWTLPWDKTMRKSGSVEEDLGHG
jgi:hypothetical protein